jgi:O-antigen/teichoic acid export membrane protein
VNKTIANYASGPTQSLISIIVLFILYRVVNQSLGATEFGFWSILMGISSAARLADFGLGASCTYFCAKWFGKGQSRLALQSVDTTSHAVLLILLFILPIAAIALSHSYYLFLPPELVNRAIIFTPFLLVTVAFGMLALVQQGGIRGINKGYLASMINISGYAILLCGALKYTPKYGIFGLIIVQLIQALTVFVASYICLSISLESPIFRMPTISLRLLSQMISYGLNVQASSALSLFLDPVAKILLSRYGGIEASGYFELANQAAYKLRSLVVSANEAIVPYLVMSETANRLYLERANKYILLLSVVPMLLIMLAISPYFTSFLGVSSGQVVIKNIFVISSFVWSLNALASGAYFSNMGSARVGTNTVSSLIMSFINVALGFLLGSSIGVYGVIASYFLAVSLGSIYLITVHEINKLSMP